MKTIAFSTILAEVCQLIGLDKNTLNDKSFATIRDLSNRRIGTIWDREEWPDIQRYQRVWPGTPITSLTVSPISILTESGTDLLQEDGDYLWFQNAENTVPLVVQLNTNHKRIYLQDFADPLFQQGTVGSSTISFINPFFLLMDDGTKVSVDERKYDSFTYTTLADNEGDYITSITTDISWGSIITQGSFGIQTTLLFEKNKQCVVLVDGQVIGAFSDDPRKTSKSLSQAFLVENFPNLYTGGIILNKDLFLIRFNDATSKVILVRSVAPWIFGAKFDNTLTYNAGAQVYYDDIQASGEFTPVNRSKGSNGNFWTCVANVGQGVAPQNPSSYWKQVEIPTRFKDYLVNGIAADFMRSEGRFEEAGPLDQLAEMSIQQQIDVLIRQQGQIQKMNMVYTY